MSDKWITGGTKKGSQAKIYHTDRDCIHLKKAQDDREISDREIEWHGMEQCNYCSELESR